MLLLWKKCRCIWFFLLNKMSFNWQFIWLWNGCNLRAPQGPLPFVNIKTARSDMGSPNTQQTKLTGILSIPPKSTSNPEDQLFLSDDECHYLHILFVIAVRVVVTAFFNDAGTTDKDVQLTTMKCHRCLHNVHFVTIFERWRDILIRRSPHQFSLVTVF